MSRDDWPIRVRHMIERIDYILRWTEGKDADALHHDVLTSYAVQLAFIHLGEAANHVPPHIVDAHPEVEWSSIRRFRNFIVHVYDQIDAAKLLVTVRDDLPPLRARLIALLDDFGGD